MTTTTIYYEDIRYESLLPDSVYLYIDGANDRRRYYLRLSERRGMYFFDTAAAKDSLTIDGWLPYARRFPEDTVCAAIENGHQVYYDERKIVLYLTDKDKEI